MTRRSTQPSRTSRKTRHAVEILDHLSGDDRKIRAAIAHEVLNGEVAMMIYEVRQRAGLTQAALAELVGTKQSVIARLEDADYKGHSLSMLQRIASAVGARLEVRIVRK